MKNSILIRQYKKRDTQALVDIFYNAYHKIMIRDYSQEQIDACAPKIVFELSGWQKKWNHNPPIIAIIDDIIVGFAEFELNGHIDCFYVHHSYQSHGIGSALIKEIEKIAHQNNINRLFANVSITAQSFFEKKGFTVLKRQTIVRRGVKLDNFVMEKLLTY